MPKLIYEDMPVRKMVEIVLKGCISSKRNITKRIISAYPKVTDKLISHQLWKMVEDGRLKCITKNGERSYYIANTKLPDPRTPFQISIDQAVVELQKAFQIEAEKFYALREKHYADLKQLADVRK